MIACDNKLCEYEWFYVTWIHIKHAPNRNGIALLVRSNNIAMFSPIYVYRSIRVLLLLLLLKIKD